MKIKTAINVGVSIIRNVFLKIKHKNRYEYKGLYSLPLLTHFELGKESALKIGKRLSARSHFTINVRDNAVMEIGDRVIFNDNCSITCRDSISIGNDVIFGPGCCIFDHDHDYRCAGLERKNNYLTGSVKIGNGVWFGANCIILRNTDIGDNCVFGAGSVIKGKYERDLLVVSRKDEVQKVINYSDRENCNCNK